MMRAPGSGALLVRIAAVVGLIERVLGIPRNQKS